MEGLGLNGFLEAQENDLDVIVADDNELDGIIEELGRLPRKAPQRKKFNRIIRKNKTFQKRALATNQLSAKAEFEKRLHLLPASIRRELQAGKLQIVEGNLYAIKAADQVSVLECFANGDDKTVGETNLNARKLEANQFFLVTAIRLQYGTGANPKAIDFSSFELPAAVKNGEFTLELGNEVLIPDVSSEIFNTYGMTDRPKGYYKLENPKLLKPQIEVNAELKFASTTAENAAVKIELIGATIAKS